MKKVCVFLMMLTLLLFGNALAWEDISGIWEGKLVVAPGSELVMQFKIKQKEDGSYGVIVNIPAQGGTKNVPADSVSYDHDANRLKLEVAEYNGSFEGVVADNSIDGKWSQQGSSFPLVLRPYVEAKLSQASMDTLRGRWQGKLDSPLADFMIVFRFEKSDTGDFVGFMDVPAQGARGIPISDIALDNGDLTLEINPIASTYKATFADNRFKGKWLQAGQEIPLTLEKGGKEEIHRLALSEASLEAISGHWNGKLTIPQASMTITIVLRFEKTDQGDIIGFLESPDQGASAIPITEAELDNGAFIFKVKGRGVEYAGNLAEDTMVGKWKQMGLPGEQDLALKKGRVKAKELALSAADMERLSGRWQGRVDTPQGTLRVVFRFETTDEGAQVGYLDSPDQGARNIPINEATLTEGDLALKISGLAAEYKGKLSGDAISGQMTIRNQSFDVPLERK